MGHSIHYMEFPKNATEKRIGQERAEVINWEGDYKVGDYQNDYTLHNIICDTREEAMKKIDEYDNGWYDDHGVMFRDYSKVKPTKQMEDVQNRIVDTLQKCKEYESEHMPNKVKAEFIGCKVCGSKVAKKYVHDQYCPVCRSDMRPKTTLDRIQSYKDKVTYLKRKYTELEKKQKNKAEVKWLIKLEFHC